MAETDWTDLAQLASFSGNHFDHGKMGIDAYIHNTLFANRIRCSACRSIEYRCGISRLSSTLPPVL